MTKHVVCSVWDNAAEAYAAPFLAPTSAHAVRSFRQHVNNPPENSSISTNPGDFELFMVGTFDDQAGTFEPANERLARAIDLKEAQ